MKAQNRAAVIGADYSAVLSVCAPGAVAPAVPDA